MVEDAVFLYKIDYDGKFKKLYSRYIFRQLAPRHLKTALLVCSRWRQVGEAPGLWRNVHLRLTRENIRLLPGLLGARRVGAVREVTIGRNLTTDEFAERDLPAC